MSDWKSRAEPANTSWRDRAEAVAQPAEEPSYLSKLVRGQVKALPMYGSVAGGLIGAPLGPFGMVGGAGLGAGIGKAAENLINTYGYGEESPYKSTSDAYNDYAKEIALGGMSEIGGQALGAGIGALSKNVGKSIYKSGLKAIDNEAVKYGKDPVSDVLFKHGITGDASAIQKQMDELSGELLTKRNDILKQASRGEVDIPKALAPVRARIQIIRNSKDPALQPLADQLESEVAKYMNLAGKPSEDILRELPRAGVYTPEHTALDTVRAEGGGLMYKKTAPEISDVASLPSNDNYVGPYRAINVGKKQLPIGAVNEVGAAPYPKLIQPDMGQIIPESTNFSPKDVSFDYSPGLISGKYVPEKFELQSPAVALDRTDAVMGPSPLQASGYKTSIGANIPDNAWKSPSILSAYQGADKEFYGGMKGAVEDAVDSVLPGSGSEVREINKDIGGLLTSQDKAIIEAAKENNKNAFTSVDGMLAAATTSNPYLLPLKKAADIAKMTGPRTKFGMGLYNFGNNGLIHSVNGAPAAIPLYQGLLKGTMFNE